MMLIKILKRRDASSVIVAVLVAMIVSQALLQATGPLAGRITSWGTDNKMDLYGGGGGWRNQYLFPIVWTLLELVVLEVLAWIVVLANRPVKRKK